MEKEFFDYNILLNRTMNDPELAKEILNDFIFETPDLISKIEEAIQSKNLNKIISLSHELKGSSATIAANELTKKSKEIEFKGRDNNLKDISKSLNELKDIYNRTKILIEQEDY